MHRRLTALALTACLAISVASCRGAGTDEPGGPVAVGEGIGDGSTTTAADGGAPAGGAGENTTTSAGNSGRPGGGAGGGGGDGGAPSGPTTSARQGGGGRTTTTAPDEERLGKGPVGSFARTILRPGVTDRVLVERLQQAGVSLQNGTVSHAQKTMGDVTKKPVSMSDPIGIPGGGEAWTAEKLRALADQQTKNPNGGSTAVIHVLVLRGQFEGTDDTLGVAVRGDVLAVFPEVIRGHAPADRLMNEVEDAVLIHELGHILGLVDLARDTGRDDPQHPGHSRSDESVMFWAIESDQVFLLLTGPPPREFDADDLADLAALREGK